MIRLTRANGKAIYVNPEHLVEVGHDEDYAQTLVSTMAEGWYVLESPEEVARKVLEWRLAMERYRVSYALAMQTEDSPSVSAEHVWSEKEMKQLAGLEEPKNAHP